MCSSGAGIIAASHRRSIIVASSHQQHRAALARPPPRGAMRAIIGGRRTRAGAVEGRKAAYSLVAKGTELGECARQPRVRTRRRGRLCCMPTAN
jgi:hypothetical protein